MYFTEYEGDVNIRIALEDTLAAKRLVSIIYTKRYIIDTNNSILVVPSHLYLSIIVLNAVFPLDKCGKIYIA